MKFELTINNEHKMGETIDALKNASEDGYCLNAHEKTLILDASFIFQAMFDQTETGKRIKAINDKRALNNTPNETN